MSLADEKTIYNMALRFLVDDYRVESISDSHPKVVDLNFHYPHARDECLQEHAWNFAKTRTSIGVHTTAPAFGWDHYYAFPPDCIRILPITKNGDPEGDRIRYELETLDTGSGQYQKVIATDADTPLKIRYIARIKDPAQYTPLFVEALAAKLALKLAYGATAKSGLTQRLGEMYTGMMDKAQMHDAMEDDPGYAYPYAESWVDAR